MKKSLGPITLVYPMPAFLVGSYDETGKANIMTAAWGGICCSEPPLLAVSIRKQRWTYKAIMSRKAFTISIPSEALAAETDYAGIVSGAHTDKFSELNLTPKRAEFVDAPYVAQCPVVVELAFFSSLDLGSHTQFIGEIKDVKVNADCLEENGKPLFEKIRPLLYEGGTRQYCGMGTAIAKAFSAGKAFSKK